MSALVAGCTETDSNPLASDPTGVEEPFDARGLRILPDSASTTVGLPIQLAAMGARYGVHGKPIDADWSATGGRIDSTGLFSADVAGTYIVKGRRKGRYKNEEDSTIVRVDPPVPVGVEITPDSAALVTGSKQAFAARTVLSDRSTKSASVAWQATGGTIDASGVYSAPNTAGTYRVIARVENGFADTAEVDVGVAPTAEITRVVLSPESTSLTPGGTQAFTAVARFSDGTTGPAPLSYTATGGTITAAGLFTAGTTAGGFRVIAAAANGKADTASVSINAAGPTVEQVFLTPATASLAPGGTQQYAASAKMSDGSTATVQVTFNVTGGTITSGGLYTAGNGSGNHRVVGTSANGKADTSAVTIGSSGPTLQRIELTPASVSLAAGGTQQFTATGRMSDGSTSQVAVTYSGTGGSLTGSGLYTAGQVSGTYRVVATAGGNLSDTSSVTIGSATGGTGELAAQADSLVNTLGVNTHMGYLDKPMWQNWPLLKARLIEGGFRHVRDGVGQYPDIGNRFKELAAVGIKMTGLCMPASYGGSYFDFSNSANNDWTKAGHCVTQADALGTGTISAIEGANEVDGTGGGDWVTKYRTFQQALWSAFKNNGTWSGRPVTAHSLYSYQHAGMVGDMRAYLDFGNMHPYPGGQMPSHGLLTHNVPEFRKISGPKPLFATETGYHNSISNSKSTWDQPGVSELASGKYVSRLWFEYFNSGVARTFIYDLINDGNDPDFSQTNYGMLRADGSPKPQFTATKHIAALLKDPGPSFQAGRLDYALSGSLQNVHRTLLQKRDGRFYLILWQEVSSFDLSAKRDIAVPAQSVTLTLGRAARTVRVYRPLTSMAPVSEHASTQSVPLSVPDEALIVEVTF